MNLVVLLSCAACRNIWSRKDNYMTRHTSRTRHRRLSTNFPDSCHCTSCEFSQLPLRCWSHTLAQARAGHRHTLYSLKKVLKGDLIWSASAEVNVTFFGSLLSHSITPTGLWPQHLDLVQLTESSLRDGRWQHCNDKYDAVEICVKTFIAKY